MLLINQKQKRQYCMHKVIPILLFFTVVSSEGIVPLRVDDAAFDKVYEKDVTYSSPWAYTYTNASGSDAIRITVTSLKATEADPILILVKRQQSVLSWQIPLILEDTFHYTTVSRILCPSENPTPTGNQTNSMRMRMAKGEEFTIEIITLSTDPIPFSIRTETISNFQQEGQPSLKIQASPWAPQYVQYKMREGAHRILIKLDSVPEAGGNLCSFLSIQSARCPVGDLDTRLRLDGRFQTVTTQGAIEVSREQFNGTFFIAVLVKPHDEDCRDRQEMFSVLKSKTNWLTNTSSHERVKTVVISVIDIDLKQNHYVIAIVAPVAIFVGFFLVAITLLQSSASEWIAVLFMKLDGITLPTKERTWGISRLMERSVHGFVIPSKWDPTSYADCHDHLPHSHEEIDAKIMTRSDSLSHGTPARISITLMEEQNVSENPNPDENERETDQVNFHSHPHRNSQQSEIVATPDVERGTFKQSVPYIVEVHLPVIENGNISGTEMESLNAIARRQRRGNKVRKERSKRRGRGRRVRMADINHKNSTEIHQTSRDYSFSLLTVSLFYSLPVWQLVMNHQGLLLVTGNEDICYYNFSCANRLGILSDFNHVLSNIGYVVLGILFLLMVRRRAAFTAKLREKVPHIDYYGIPSQLGVFYGMGLALVMEGVMSACYHVCPSYNNFQFDTSFMYLITGLTLLKLYHSRHPDILPRSYVAYLVFAAFILVALVGVITQSFAYWIVFSVFHGMISIMVGLQIFLVGYLELSMDNVIKQMRKLQWSDFRCSALQWNRLVPAVLLISINLGFAIVGPVLQPFDFATHLLFILQANLMVYAGYYFVMKIVSAGERISRMACLYFVFALPAWIVGMHYFTQGLSNWAKSAAQSREGNRECFIFNFYDEHDVWHMLSAFGLFFTFMMLFTLDDDLATISRDKIPVF
ncbi:SID1 transmembrane family member 1 [Hypsibius exemplaris]|uniref:SID1 transmembrane family member 1 n=1 Tax=Hypsibius exemplaris TaxID=2072580 RepID=A0A1W0WXR2_HYPEX|nr:SID1 transmembrane family member 1 [Hypsibius exemplaris]